MDAKRLTLFVVAIVAGIALGYIGGPVWILIAWAAVGLALGWCSARKRLALVNGAAFGFVASYVFMIAGYNGTEPLSSRLLPFVLVGLFGALCGASMALAGRLIHR